MLWLACVVLFFGTAVWLVCNHGCANRRAWRTGLAVSTLAFMGVVWFWPSLLILRKAVALFLMPAGLVWLALIGACYLSRRERRLRWLLRGFLSTTSRGEACRQGPSRCGASSADCNQR